jgi:HlyD family secretion protein
MHKARRAAMVAIAIVLVAGVLIYSVRHSGSAATIVGVVRATEVRVEPPMCTRAMSWRGSPRWN